MSDVYAEAAAFWSTDNAKHRVWSHWRDNSSSGAWGLFGGLARTMVDHLMRATDEPEPSRVIEWGVGGGANAVQFPKATYYGVDISFPSLAEGERQYRKAGGRDFRSCPISINDPESIGLLVTDCDLFLSTYVFQHFLGKKYGARVLRVAYDTLRPGGLLVIQIRTGMQASPNRPYSEDFTRTATWTGSSFSRLLSVCGFNVILTRPVERPNDYIYFGAQKVNPKEAI